MFLDCPTEIVHQQLWLSFFAVWETEAHGKARFEVGYFLVTPDEAAPPSNAAATNDSGIKNLMVRLVKTSQPFSTPSLALPLCIFTSLLSLAGCQARKLCFHSLPCAMLKTTCTCRRPRRGPSFSCQSVNRRMPERQVVHVAQCQNVLDPCQGHQRHTQPVSACQQDYKTETLRGLNTQSKASVYMVL